MIKYKNYRFVPVALLLVFFTLVSPELIGQDLGSVQSEIDGAKGNILSILNTIFTIIIVVLALVVVYQLVNNPQQSRSYIIGLVAALVVWGIIYGIAS
jgi:carbon starvation protein CstA